MHRRETFAYRDFYCVFDRNVMQWIVFYVKDNCIAGVYTRRDSRAARIRAIGAWYDDNKGKKE